MCILFETCASYADLSIYYNQIFLSIGLSVMCLPRHLKFPGSDPVEINGFCLKTSPLGCTLKSKDVQTC